MIEITGDIWEIESDWICIPTNAEYKMDGKAVMGAGLARQAREKIPNCDSILGHWLRKHGNHVVPIGVHHVTQRRQVVLAFPTKMAWRDPSPLGLIQQSCNELRVLWQAVLQSKGIRTKVSLPRIGCGLGGASWEEIKPIAERHFNDPSFQIINYAQA